MSIVPNNPFVMCTCGHAAMDHDEEGCAVEIDDGNPYPCPCQKFEDAGDFDGPDNTAAGHEHWGDS